MTKTVKNSDPFAAVRKALVETVDAVNDGQEKASKLAHAEVEKAKAVAADQAEKAQAAVEANVSAAVAAGEVVAAGAEKAGELVFGEVSDIAENRIAAAKKIINATSLTDVIDVQVALFKAEQEKAAAFAKTFAELTQTIANDAIKPVQTQAQKNLKAFDVKAA